MPLGAVLGGHNALTRRPPGGDAHHCEDGAPVPWPARLDGPHRLALSGCSARRASCTTTSRHRRLMTRWSTRSWPPLTVSELVGVLWVFGRASRKWSPAPCDVRCALCALCCATVITDMRCVLNACSGLVLTYRVSFVCLKSYSCPQIFFTYQERES